MKVLVAGIGNIFFGDDGFGSELARRMAGRSLPDGVTVTDYGIRGMHLAYDLLDGFDLTILLDAMARGEAPGTVSVLDVTAAGALPQPRQLDPHGMTPDAVLDLVGTLGGTLGQVYVVGCEPADCDERIGLSAPVSAAIEPAAAAVLALLTEVGTSQPVR